MERIKVPIPKYFPFSTSLTVRITDINYGGHLGNDSLLSLVHEARIQFLHNYGYSELEFEGTGIIMTDAAIEYKKQLKYGDIVKISVAASGFDKLGFDIFYLLELLESDTLQLAGRVKTGMICFDYIQGKKVSVPAKAIEKLSYPLS